MQKAAGRTFPPPVPKFIVNNSYCNNDLRALAACSGAHPLRDGARRLSNPGTDVPFHCFTGPPANKRQLFTGAGGQGASTLPSP